MEGVDPLKQVLLYKYSILDAGRQLGAGPPGAVRPEPAASSDERAEHSLDQEDLPPAAEHIRVKCNHALVIRPTLHRFPQE